MIINRRVTDRNFQYGAKVVTLVLPPDDDDDAYLRLQHGKGFHNLVYMLRNTHKPS
jgi:hypothetical protein